MAHLIVLVLLVEGRAEQCALLLHCCMRMQPHTRSAYYDRLHAGQMLHLASIMTKGGEAHCSQG